jgi:hypothetical protein
VTSGGAASSKSVEARAELDGPHLICVLAPGNTGAVAYDLVIGRGDACLPDLYELNEGPPIAAPLPLDGQQDLTLCGDEDWFTFSAPAGSTLQAQVEPRGCAPALSVYPESGGALARSQDPLQPSVNVQIPQGGRFFLYAENPSGCEGGYGLQARLLPPADQGCVEDALAQALPLGVYVEGALCDDEDRFTIDAPAGAFTVTAARGADEGALSLELRANGGLELLGRGQRRGDELVAQVLLPQATQLQVVLRSDGSYRAPYVLRATQELLDVCRFDLHEPDEAPAQGALLGGFGGLRRGSLCGEAEDRYRLLLDAGEAAELVVSWLPGLARVELSLLDPQGQELGAASPLPGADQVVLRLPPVAQAGEHRVVLSNLGPGDNAYDLVWRVLPDLACDDDALEPDDARDEAAPLSLALGDSSLCPQDEDWRWVELQAGSRVEVFVEQTEAWGTLDAALYAPDLSLVGALVGGAERQARAVFTAPTTGRYALQLSSQGLGALRYRASVRPLD